jgi:hypothetical protein
MPTRPARLSRRQLEDHVSLESATVRRIVLDLRSMILEQVPHATEAIRFHALCYYEAGSPYGSIGGNICMIGVREGRVSLQFIHGVDLPDPHGLLRGKAKAKRHVPIADREAAGDPRLIDPVRAAAAAAQERGAAGARQNRHRARRAP